jgi:hypothetical protein
MWSPKIPGTFNSVEGRIEDCGGRGGGIGGFADTQEVRDNNIIAK